MTVQWCETTFWAPTFASENGSLVLPTWHKVNGFQPDLATCHVRRLMSLHWGKFCAMLEDLCLYLGGKFSNVLEIGSKFIIFYLVTSTYFFFFCHIYSIIYSLLY